MVQIVFLLLGIWQFSTVTAFRDTSDITLNKKDTGYRGIWYMNQPSGDQYVYKYSGGLGTYCAKHRPFAVYSPEVKKTFFCYGGTTVDSNRRLLHMVSYFDHVKKLVPKPTVLLDKNTDDAHDNPVISMDNLGYIWIFSTSHGTSRPSYIHKSRKPYNIDEFIRIEPVLQTKNSQEIIDNFSYMQAWYLNKRGFIAFFTKYNDPVKRTICVMTSSDGVQWHDRRRLATIGEGHYQISAATENLAGSAFNYHPIGKGLNWRTNLYFIQTKDFGQTWQSVAGDTLSLPLTQVKNPALIQDYEKAGLNVYLKDIRFDADDRPVILFLTSRGFQSGPRNDPRWWMTARWDGKTWRINKITTSDNNYDMGSLWITSDGDWHLIAPTGIGPQAYNPGGEIVHWLSKNRGESWLKKTQVTRGSDKNNTYVRRPVQAHKDFFAFWADGNARKPSESDLYFSDLEDNVFRLPRRMEGEMARPALVKFPLEK